MPSIWNTHSTTSRVPILAGYARVGLSSLKSHSTYHLPLFQESKPPPFEDRKGRGTRQTDVFSPDPKFSWVDERHLGPVAIFVLEATKPYLERFFREIPETKLLLTRIDDLMNRIFEVGAIHETLMIKKD
jgi:hypothetical protein